jgi:hypothetical protein
MPLAFQTVVRQRLRWYGYLVFKPAAWHALAVLQAV